ncbi:uncharacterized protein LOC135487036 [Lineus longissimus]|uniref:uncharacterized protein LOC135487036 n=1 Tax=Lineus longissimus TaxID=88925 RepID=UPI002B4DA848
MVFSGEACGVEVRMDVFEKIGAFGNQKCDHGCNLGAIEASLQASWDKIQPFFDFLNDWLENSISPWSLKNPSCTEIVEPAIIAVRDAVVNSGNCKPKALAVFLDGGYGLFEKDDLGIESSAYSRCNSFRHHSEFFKSHYRQWPTDAHGIAQVIMSNMLVVGIERTS